MRPYTGKARPVRRSWHGAHQQRARFAGRYGGYHRRSLTIPMFLALMLMLSAGGLIGLTLPQYSDRDGSRLIDNRIAVHFSLCHSGGGRNCVVDGDTFWINGEKIRIADIDTPETHPPRCAREARLGRQATQRLHSLLNAGPVQLERQGEDRYGRTLAVVRRDGRSLGIQLVDEGLARRYSGGRRASWCV